MTLKFSEKAHRYWCDGKPIPGVTTLIKGGLPSPALVYWSAKSVAEYVADNADHVEQLRTMGRAPMVAALKSVPWEARDQAAIRGTDVHTLAEDLVAGREVAVPEHLADYVDGYVAWLDLWQPEPIWTERPVANRRWWYAGKPDIVCRIGSDVWLLDWKTARGIYGDNAIQTAAYANAEFSMTPEGDEELVQERCAEDTCVYRMTKPDAHCRIQIHRECCHGEWDIDGYYCVQAVEPGAEMPSTSWDEEAWHGGTI